MEEFISVSDQVPFFLQPSYVIIEFRPVRKQVRDNQDDIADVGSLVQASVQSFYGKLGIDLDRSDRRAFEQLSGENGVDEGDDVALVHVAGEVVNQYDNIAEVAEGDGGALHDGVEGIFESFMALSMRN